MLSQPTSAAHRIELPAGALLRLDRAAGTRITVVRGTAWITEEGHVQDTVLRAGDRFTLQRPGLAIAQMLEAGTLRVEGRAPSATARGFAMARV